MEKEVKTPSSGIARFKKVNKLNAILSIVILIVTVVTCAINILFSIVYVQEGVTQMAAQIMNGISFAGPIVLILLIIPWAIFVIFSMIRGFKARPNVKPVVTLILSILALCFVIASPWLLLAASIIPLSLIDAGMQSVTEEAVLVPSIIMIVIGLSLMLAGIVPNIVVSQNNKKAVKAK